MTRVVAGAFVRPMPGETVAGDACLVEAWTRGVVVAVADGLGHGPAAAKAATAFLDCVRAGREEPLLTVLASAHETLRRMRGAVAVIARFDETGDKVEIAGVGNVTVLAVNGAGDPRPVVIPVGFVGGTYRAVRPQVLDFRGGDMLLLHTDGVRSRFELAPLRSLAPAELARAIVAEHGLPSDDAACVVALGT